MSRNRTDGAGAALVGRRSVLAAAILLLPLPAAPARAQEPSPVADFTRGLTASASFFLDFSRIIEAASRDGRLGRREKRQLRRLLSSAEELQYSNMATISVMESYARNARTGPVSASAWRNIVDEAEDTLVVVGRTREVAESSDVLSAELGADQALLFGDLLNARSLMLSPLAGMPPPTTEEELAEFDAMIVQYRYLMDAQLQLRTAIEAALE